MKVSFSIFFAASGLMAAFAGSCEAGAWTLPKGRNWLKVGFMFQDTTERYFLDGERMRKCHVLSGDRHSNPRSPERTASQVS